MSTIRVVVASDDRLLSEGLVRLLATEPSFTVVGEGDCPVNGRSLRAAQADVLVLDSQMDGALPLCATLREDGGPAVLFIAAREDDDWALRALEAGARGVLARSARSEERLKAVRLVSEGQIWARRQVIAAALDRAASAANGIRAANPVIEDRLSLREREVFRQAATGLSNRELADCLAISEGTVKAHLTSIFQKLGLRCRAELAAAYHGVISAQVQPTAPPSIRPSA